MIATLKHFPGHGDTDVDSHLGLPVDHVRSRAARTRGAGAVPERARPARRSGDGRAHRAAGARPSAVDAGDVQQADPDRPAARRARVSAAWCTPIRCRWTRSRRWCRRAKAAVRAVARRRRSGAPFAGSDRGVQGDQGGGASGRISPAQLDASVTRILRAKASLGLHAAALDRSRCGAAMVGGRAHVAVGAGSVPRDRSRSSRTSATRCRSTVPRDAPVLYLSVLDYPSGWQIAAPSRTFIPELKKRWPQVTAIEVSDRTPPSEFDLVRAIAPRYAAIVASVFVRATSGSGRLDLVPGAGQAAAGSGAHRPRGPARRS